MNVSTLSHRFAATGAAAALAAAALVGGTSTGAQAVEVTNSYSCTNPAGGDPWVVTVVSDAPGIDGFPEVPAGFDAPGGLLAVSNEFTIPSSAHATLVGFSVEDLSFPDYAGTFGPEPVAVDSMTAKVSEMTDNSDGTHSFQSDGLNAAFEAPAAGTYDVLSPAAFTMEATVPGLGQVPSNCTIAEGTTAGPYATDIRVVKNESATTGKPVARTLKATRVAAMKVAVSAPNEVPGGKVVVKEGRKTLGSAKLNKAGKATVKMGRLKKGKHAVKVFYSGDRYTLKSTSKKIVFKVARR